MTPKLFSLSVVDLPQQPETTKTSHAEITLKSATLPRRKPTKMEIHVDVKPKVSYKDIKLQIDIERDTKFEKFEFSYTYGNQTVHNPFKRFVS